jgi:acyl-coenzyme A thioesterase PaaI-like protein
VAGAKSGRVARALPTGTWSRRALTSLPHSPTAISTGGVDAIGKGHKLPNLSLTEVPNLALFHHLCETTASFVHDVLRLKVVSVAPGRLTLEMAVTPEMVGNPTPATIHGGVIAAAIDHTAGEIKWEIVSTLHFLCVCIIGTVVFYPILVLIHLFCCHSGFCCWSTFDSEVCSTMNLRIDYLKPLLLSDRSKL